MTIARTIARSALAATAIGISALATVSLAAATPAGPWGNEQSVIDAFPELLPATPTEYGYHHAFCEAHTDTNSYGEAGVSCYDQGGIAFTVDEYTDPSQIDFLVRALGSGSSTNGELRDGTTFTAYNGESDGQDFVIVTFDSVKLDNFTIFAAAIGGAPGDVEAWLADAPIGG
ncbi:hypothetical protein [Antrihabitans sp. YC2-6]|uniref:hypothetical protein n=1 Tax=Antrihabitans sp. YC2-6 TaxID=2799498 RepID=UPI0018F57C2D|nr:hypothetical protein [Antrihabitans sp. YC2-6]MBJ8343499.1 hypothetical protein [Antrihabitans sp. YC2-6]